MRRLIITRLVVGAVGAEVISPSMVPRLFFYANRFAIPNIICNFAPDSTLAQDAAWQFIKK